VTYFISDEAVDSDAHVVAVGGELDMNAAPELKESILGVVDEGKTRVVVDLTEATFIDSTAIGVLVGGLKRLREAGGSLDLVCNNENILRIFEIVGLDQAFAIHDSRGDAVSAAARAG
jgi:anti-sigma B factor antagonist